MSYEIQILNAADKIIKLPGQFLGIDCALLYNNISRWIIRLPYSSDLWGIGQDTTNKVRILRDGVELIRGEITDFERNKAANNTVTLSGSSPEQKLADRRAVPVPAGPPYTSADYDVQTGAAETVIKYYVNYNAGPAAVLARRVAGLTIQTDAASGSTITGRARFHKLLDLIRNLATQGGVGFRFIGMEFQVFIPTDRSRTAVFDEERGSLTGFKYHSKRPTANYYYAGGAGTGTGRTFYESGDSDSVVQCGRIETFLDCRQAASTSEIQGKIDEEIGKNSSTAEFSAELINGAGGLLAFQNYNLGDQVTAIADGQILTALVREITVKVDDKGGEKITPIVGSYRATGNILRRLSNNNSERIENLEVV